MARRKKVYKVVRGQWSVYASGRYQIQYIPGTTVTAPSNSYGLMTFPSHADALKFARKHSGSVIEVRPIGKGRKVKWLSNDQGEHAIDSFYAGKKLLYGELLMPSGTVCYPAVEVL